MWNVGAPREDFWSRPPPSRPVSMGYVNLAHMMEDNEANFTRVPYSNQQLHRDFDVSQSQHTSRRRCNSYTPYLDMTDPTPLTPGNLKKYCESLNLANLNNLQKNELAASTISNRLMSNAQRSRSVDALNFYNSGRPGLHNGLLMGTRVGLLTNLYGNRRFSSTSIEEGEDEEGEERTTEEETSYHDIPL